MKTFKELIETIYINEQVGISSANIKAMERYINDYLSKKLNINLKNKIKLNISKAKKTQDTFRMSYDITSLMDSGEFKEVLLEIEMIDGSAEKHWWLAMLDIDLRWISQNRYVNSTKVATLFFDKKTMKAVDRAPGRALIYNS
jgi:hypothetical protein